MNNPPAAAQLRVVIVGGGFSGAAVAWHLANLQKPDRISISVIEPRSKLGAGLAYSSTETTHRVNVPAARMSLLPDDLGHFSRWLAERGELGADPDARSGENDVYPRRQVFGRYVADHLEPYLQTGAIRHIRDHAESVEPTSPSDGWTVKVSSGLRIEADIVVIATTHPPPAIPDALLPISREPNFVADPYAARALSGIAADASVLVVGSGLSFADMAVELDRRGHRGRILALSRHGLRSRAQAHSPVEPFGEFALDPASTALQLLSHVRAALRDAKALGFNWHSVMEKLRLQAGMVWTALEPDERTRLVHKLRSFWDVHRFRIAPPVGAVLDRRIAAGTLEIIAARLAGSAVRDGKLEVAFRRRGSVDSDVIAFDAVVNTTGPAHRAAVSANPALHSLSKAGYIRNDRYGLGIDTDTASNVIASDGTSVPNLFVAGPLARGAFGELMGLPEVARHAQSIANAIGRRAETPALQASLKAVAA